MLKRKPSMPLLTVLFLLTLGACSSTKDSRKFASEQPEKTYEIEKGAEKVPAWKHSNRRYR